MKQAIIEALKELLRVVLIAVLPILISSLESGKIDYKIILVTAAIALLRAVDKWMHEWGKNEANKNFDLAQKLKGGLTRF